MRQMRSSMLGAALLASLTACATTGGGGGVVQGPPPPPTPQVVRAAEGESVYLIHHYILADQRQQFESFVDEVLWAALRHDTSERGRQRAERVRLLKPVSADTDGAWVYTFVLDPLLPGERYDIFELLRARYGEEDALRHYERYTGTWQRDFVAGAFVQGRGAVR
jgi:hypothetical protein